MLQNSSSVTTHLPQPSPSLPSEHRAPAVRSSVDPIEVRWPPPPPPAPAAATSAQDVHGDYDVPRGSRSIGTRRRSGGRCRSVGRSEGGDYDNKGDHGGVADDENDDDSGIDNHFREQEAAEVLDRDEEREQREQHAQATCLPSQQHQQREQRNRQHRQQMARAGADAGVNRSIS
ncbi:unnamed protein product, partial [Sphacelaria rigidula]